MINLNDKFITDVMPRIGAKATVVLLAICKHIDVNKRAFPGKKLIQKYTGLGRDAITRELNKLQATGLLKKSQLHRNGKLSTNEYLITTDLIGVYVGTNKMSSDTKHQSTDFQAADIQATDIQCTDFQATLSINNTIEVLTSKEVLTNKEGNAEFLKTLIDSVIIQFNEITGRNFKVETTAYRKLIQARIKEGSTIEDFTKVIELKNLEWSWNPEMKIYLTPDTLFRPSKFPKYLEHAERLKSNEAEMTEFINNLHFKKNKNERSTNKTTGHIISAEQANQVYTDLMRERME